MADAVEKKRAAKSSTSWICPLDKLVHDVAAAAPSRVGGKASRLAWLARHGFVVPETWVVSASAFSAALRELPPACEPHSLLRAATSPMGEARAAEARAQLLTAAFPPNLEAELAALWAEVADRAPWGLAVRSSATCEDGALVSMAGIAESVLGVRGERELAEAVRSVWASIAAGRALGYLAARGLRDIGMAVVIQRVVVAEASGVMFTRSYDQQHYGRSRERIVNVGFGLGAPVVDGVVAPDMLRLREDGSVVEQTIARKPMASVVGPHGVRALPTAEPDAPALDAACALELATLARRLESIEDVPWDVEFAVERVDQREGPSPRRVTIVQARHVTGLGYPEGGDASTVFSNANVGEALPGVATPFTWSVAREYSEAGFRRAFATLGCAVPKHAHLIANVHGRFYLNLSAFMEIAAQVPWLDPRVLVELGGGAGAEELKTQWSGVSHRRFFAKLPWTVTRLVREQRHLDDAMTKFEAEAAKVFRLHASLDLAILPDEGIVRKIHDVRALLARTGDVMLACASTSLGAHILLKSVLRRVVPDGTDSLVNELARGIDDLASARPAIGILRIAHLARTEPEARAIIERDGATVADLPEGPTNRALRAFLELHGDRAVRETELSTPRWREDTSAVVAMVRVALRADPTDADPKLARTKEHAADAMRRVEARLNIAERRLVRSLATRARTAARRREQMRAWVTRVLGMLRQTVLEADRRLLRLMPELAQEWEHRRSGKGPLAVTHTAFFLTCPELCSTLHSSRTDLAPLVRARRAEFARDLARPDPPATFIGAPPEVLVPPSGGDILRGTGASPGVVTGPARVLASASEMGALEPGEVLVVRTTDIGWTPVFSVAAGIVTELGGSLSHAAVVARELGVPSVVNIEGVTRALRTGDLVRVDGGRGIVERIVRASS